MIQEHFVFLVGILLLGICCPNKVVFGGSMRFPDSAEETSEAGKVIDEILTASRAGRNLRLSVGGKDLEEPLALSSDPKFKALSEGGSEARSYVASKLCSLGLAKCGEERHGGGGGGQYGLLNNIRDVQLVQPVQLRPIGEPIAAIPLENSNRQQQIPYGQSSSSFPSGKYMNSGFGNYPSENQNYPNYNQGGIITNSQQDCTCVTINQCNSYDIVNGGGSAIIGNNPMTSGTGNYYPGGGVVNGVGRPHYGNVGGGIDPRSKKSEIESNATVVDSKDDDGQTPARSVRSEVVAVEEESTPALTNITSSSSSTVIEEVHREKREAQSSFNTDPRIVKGGLGNRGGCYDDRLVCCRNPIKGPTSSSYPIGSNNYPSNSGGSSYPIGGSSNFPSTSGSSYPNSDYNPTRPGGTYYPQKPITNEYYPNGAVNNGACGKRNSNGVNGRVLSGNYAGNSAEFGEYPWQAALLKKDGSNSVFVCGASIIDNKHLLTAAHCIKNNRPEELRVRLGEWDVNSENEFYPHIEFDVAAIAIHPEYYAGNLINDLAIIKLAGFVDFARYPHISPICLPPRGYDFTGTRCYATGWGKDAFGQGGKFQRILQEVDVPVINHYECEQKLRRTRLGPDFSLHKGFLCAGGEPEKDACKGDGGGPLSCEVGGSWQLAGVVSWGVGCGSYGTPGVYVQTTAYLDWIRQTIQ